VQLVVWLLHQSGPPTLAEYEPALGWDWALPVLFSVIGALIVARQPRNRVGWLLMIPALVVATPTPYALETPRTALTPALWLQIWVDGWSWIPIIFSIFLIPLHFPTGRPPSPRWRWINWLAVGMWLFFIIATAFVKEFGPVDYDWTLPNPIGFIPVALLEGSFLIVWGLGLLTIVGASVASLFVRYRRAHAVERQQIKWLLYVGAIFVLFYGVVYFTSSDSDQFGAMDDWVNLLFTLSILAFPVAIAIAILRYRLFDIDVIIRRTVVYGLLSLLLALVYFGMVVLLQSIFAAATAERSPLIIVLSTLLIAALFAPLRARVQAFVDRRFYRQKYNAQLVLADFAQTARTEVSLEELAADLSQVVQETMQPESVSVWLKEGAK
jgi:hypothetical protein